MTRRSYHQFCGLAAALDLVGERWTLLVVRELMTGPKRYSDLTDGLPGIGTSLLAQRLRRLEADGIIVRRTLPPPAPATIYELSDAGHELGRAIMPLVSWGLTHALPGTGNTGQPMRARWAILPFVYALAPADVAGPDRSFEFRVGDDTAVLALTGGRAHIVAPDPHRAPNAAFVLSGETAADIGAGRLGLEEALATGRLRIEGDADAATSLAVSFQPDPRSGGAPAAVVTAGPR